MYEQVSPVRIIAQAIWHLLRYVGATCVSTTALAAIPILVVSAFVLFQLSGFIFFFLGLVPLEDPMSLVLVPLLLVIFEIVAVLVSLLTAAGLTVVAVLPTSLLVELVLWKLYSWELSIRMLFTRLASFVIGGVLLGVLLGAVGLLCFQPDRLVSIGFVYLGLVFISTCTVFLFGSFLTMMKVVGKGVLALGKVVKGKTVNALWKATTN